MSIKVPASDMNVDIDGNNAPNEVTTSQSSSPTEETDDAKILGEELSHSDEGEGERIGKRHRRIKSENGSASTAIVSSPKKKFAKEENSAETSSPLVQCDPSSSHSGNKSEEAPPKRGRAAKKSVPAKAAGRAHDELHSDMKKRRYVCTMQRHFEMDVDSALVYIDGGLAARVCSVIKNCIDEVPGSKVNRSLASAKKGTKKGKETKESMGPSSSGGLLKRNKALFSDDYQKSKRRRSSISDDSVKSDNVACSSSAVVQGTPRISKTKEVSQKRARRSSPAIDIATTTADGMREDTGTASVVSDETEDTAVENAIAKDTPGSHVKRCEKNGKAVKMNDDVKKTTKESMKNECKEGEMKDGEEVVDEESFQAEKSVGDEQKAMVVGKKEIAPTAAIVAAEIEQGSSAACEKEANAEVQVVSKDEASASVKDSAQLESTTIADMSDEQIATTFGLIPFAVVIERLDEESVATLQEEVRREVRSQMGKQLDKDSSKKKLKKSKGARRSRVGSSSPESERENAPSISEQLDKKDKKRNRSDANRTCSTCEKNLNDCVKSWSNPLGPRSAYCSMECVRKQVDKANEVIGDMSARVMLLDRSGTMLNGPSAPVLSELFDFLCQHSEFAPVLPSHRSPKKTPITSAVTAKNEQDEKVRKQGANKVEKMLPKEIDQRRLQVRRAICEKLQTRAKKTPQLLFTLQELKALSQRIEEELFRQCRQSVSGKYRSWFRQFISCLTDESNKGFYLRTILGNISVPKLVSLDATELSSPKFAAEMELPQSRKSPPKKVQNGKSVDADGSTKGLKTEESKEITAADGEHVVDATADLDPFPEKKRDSKAFPPIKAESEVDKILGMEPVNTTAQHRFHLFDMNCDICTGKKERELSNLQKKEAKERKRMKRISQKRHIEEEQHKCKGSSWRSATRPSSTDADAGNEPLDDLDDGGFPMDDDDERYKPSDNPPVRISDTWRVSQYGIGREEDEHGMLPGESWRRPVGIEEEMLMYETWRPLDSDERKPLVGSFLEPSPSLDSARKGKKLEKEGRDRENWKKVDKHFDPRKDIEPVEEELQAPSIWDLEEEHVVWTGVITMGQYVQFSTTMTALSNERAFRLRDEFPPSIRIIGRIPPAVVFDYLFNLRKTRTKDVIILCIDNPVHPEMSAQFTKCFLDMRRKNRYSVLGLDEQPTIKDGYLIALARGERPPTVLLPYDGPGIPDDHPDMIICVIVRHRDAAAAAARIPGATSRNKQNESRVREPQKIGEVKSIVEIPLERKNRSPSPSTVMREFEYSMEERERHSPLPCIDDISPTMVHARASIGTLFADNLKTEQREPIFTDSVKVTERKSTTGKSEEVKPQCLFGSPQREDKLWGGVVIDEDRSPSQERNTDTLLPPGFLDRLQNSTPVRAPMPCINSISDLLVAIHTHTQPSEIAFLVAEFTEKNVLGPGEQELIENAVKKKVLVERKKRGEIVDEEDDAKRIRPRKSSDKEKEGVKKQVEDMMLQLSANDRQSGPATFVGDEKAEELTNISNVGSTSADVLTSGATPSSPPAAIDLNACAPPLPPPPPPPLTPSTLGIGISVPPPVPPPLPPPSFIAPLGVVTVPMPVIGPSIVTSSVAPMMATTDGSCISVAQSIATGTHFGGAVNPDLTCPLPLAGVNASFALSVSSVVDAPMRTVDLTERSSLTAPASESRSGGGEMDMDISDDDYDDSKKTALLPPPPPPPAFQVPLPQPPPVPNVPLLPIPPVPIPRPLAIPHSESGAATYFGINAPASTQATTSKLAAPSRPQPVPPPPLFPLVPHLQPPPPVPAAVLGVPPVQIANISTLSASPPKPTSVLPQAEMTRLDSASSSTQSTSNIAIASADASTDVRMRPQPYLSPADSFNAYSAAASDQPPLLANPSISGGGVRCVAANQERGVSDTNQWNTSAWHSEDKECLAGQRQEVGLNITEESTSRRNSDATFDMERYFNEADEYLSNAGPSRREPLITSRFTRNRDERVDRPLYPGVRSSAGQLNQAAGSSGSVYQGEEVFAPESMSGLPSWSDEGVSSAEDAQGSKDEVLRFFETSHQASQTRSFSATRQSPFSEPPVFRHSSHGTPSMSQVGGVRYNGPVHSSAVASFNGHRSPGSFSTNRRAPLANARGRGFPSPLRGSMFSKSRRDYW
uniref:TFIIS central domain-containing protein n=2 Tax=Parascaris univalens TaxID=6257 RepID=A0A914ZL73_PARUN